MNPEKSPPLIVGFVADLMFTPRIANVARHIGYEVKWIPDAAALGDAETMQTFRVESPGERLHGHEGRLFDTLTAWQPALLLFDLSNEQIPWRRWIALLKSSPATRRLPVMCFGSHMDVPTMTDARSVGADVVLARSRFTSEMAQLFQKYAHVPDATALTDACAEPIAPLGRQGIALFNQGQYYKCHDDLEEAWRQDTGPGRDLYQGILQVGIALYQVERGNYRGAVKMLLRVRQWLEPLPDVCRGVDVARLRENVSTYYDAIMKLGPENLSEFDWSLVAPIDLTEQ